MSGKNIEENIDWKHCLVSETATLLEAITNLNLTTLQIVLVVSSSNKLIGTITDGDIRRALLRGDVLDRKLASVMNRNPLVVTTDITQDSVFALMQANRMQHLPIVDSEGTPIGLHVLNRMIGPKDIQNIMVIMAGGKGTRLLPHTENCPKPLVRVAGKPILEHIILRAKDEGIKKFIISIHYLGQMIQDYFGDGSKFGVEINYVEEKSPLGTAGALSLIKDIPISPFLVTNGDVIAEVKYSDLLLFHNFHGSMGTMAIKPYEWINPYGVVQTSGVKITGFEEKPVNRSYINAGIYVLDPSSLKLMSEGEVCDMPALFMRMMENKKRVIAYPMHEPWADIGRPSDLIDIEKNIVKSI